MNTLERCIKILSFLLVLSHSLYGNIEAIPFKMINNLIIVEVDIESTTGNFILDTGSDAILLNSNVVSKSHNEMIFQTINGSTNTEPIKISQLKIGSISKENVSAYNTNLSNIEKFLNVKIAGIIGADFFNPHSIYLDFENKLISFYETAPDITAFNFINHIFFNMKMGIPTTEISIDNQTYTFILDSGASIHLADTKLIQKHTEIFNELSGDFNLESVGHSTKVFKYNIKNFYLNNQIVKDHLCVQKDFTEFNKGSDIEILGILSISMLTKKGILIDFHRMKMHY